MWALGQAETTETALYRGQAYPLGPEVTSAHEIQEAAKPGSVSVKAPACPQLNTVSPGVKHTFLHWSLVKVASPCNFQHRMELTSVYSLTPLMLVLSVLKPPQRTCVTGMQSLPGIPSHWLL